LQFLLKEKPDRKGLVWLKDEDYHYLVHVRRLKPGSVFDAVLPSNSSTQSCAQCVTVTVNSIDNHILTGSVTPKNSPEPDNLAVPPIVLFQALPKGTKMDLIVRQAAEGGLSEVVPFVSEHSVPKDQAGREERWRRIVKEARQQSGSTVDTRIQKLLTKDELFAYWERLQTETFALGLIFSPLIDGGVRNSESAKRLILNRPLAQGSFHHYLYKKPSLVVLAVGPEGGFSGAELKCFTDRNFKLLSLGNTILRTETAALYGSAAVNIILMEKKWWTLKQQ